VKAWRTLAISAVLFSGLGLLPSTGCGGHSSSSTPTNTIATSGSNVLQISVNSGPTGSYANGVFASVTVCAPGSSNCQTINDVLVDTGSSGLRILSSALSLSLPQQNASDGNPVLECYPFVSGYTWGPVQTADVQMAGEKASSVPIQVIGTSTAVPAACAKSAPTSSDTLDTLGANGVLGLGLFAQDCGGGCVQTDNPSQSTPPDIYFDCGSSGCTPIWENAAQQVPNPVTMFPNDNNGVIVELPAISAPQPSLTGSLVFGISTESNNDLASATVYTADPSTGNFTTIYKGTQYSGSFIDSGSNGYFFLDDTNAGMPYCDVTSSAPTGNGFYCPSNTTNFSATNQGTNGASGNVSFSIANADVLFSNSADFVFNDLGGDNPDAFDWGLPFFFNRKVYVAIQGQNAPGGTAPYWAY
jgi:hypothetical protein